MTTIQDLKSQSMARFVSEELAESIQESLSPIRSGKFELSIYFGRNMARRHDRLAKQLFSLYRAPMFRVQFARDEKDGSWGLRSAAALPANDVPKAHWPFVLEVATEYFAGRVPRQPKRVRARYDLAILHDPAEKEPPSDEKALQRFIKAGEAMGLDIERIGREDYGRLAEFDALFIRETTYVNHHTFRFARRGQRGPGGHRRSGIDRPLHEQGLSGRIARPPRRSHAKNAPGPPREHRGGAGGAGLSLRAQGAR